MSGKSIQKATTHSSQQLPAAVLIISLLVQDARPVQSIIIVELVLVRNLPGMK